MVALDEFWPKSLDAIRSITMEVVTAIFALTSLSSLLIALRVSVVCTSLSAGELWQFMFAGFSGSCDFDRPDHCGPHEAN